MNLFTLNMIVTDVPDTQYSYEVKRQKVTIQRKEALACMENKSIAHA